MNKKIVKKAFKDTLPVLTGYLFISLGFGVILHSKGYGPLWALAMSTIIYAGSMQFLAIDLITGGASLIATALTTLMVNARHLFYGISMVDRYKDTGKMKPYLIYGLTDETYSLVCLDLEMTDKERKLYYLLVSLFNQSYWVIGTVLGGVIGSFIKFNTEGIDFALTALFVTVFTEQWLSTKDHRFALVGLGSAVACLLIFGKDNFLIPAMISITLILSLLRGKEAKT